MTVTTAPPDFLWRNPEPKRAYDVVIVGGGGHGLATAYYLAKNHGITNVAVLEKGWLAGGNMARNTTIIRSNYLWDESAAHLRALAEAVGGPRGGARLRHPVQPARRAQPRAQPAGRARQRAPGATPTGSTASTPSGSTPAEVKEVCPIVNVSPDVRYPVLGATYQPRGGIAKHDHVAWGFARAADALGVDLIQNCEVTGFDVRRRAGRRRARPRGARSRRARSRCARPGTPRVLAAMVGLPAADAEPPAAGAGVASCWSRCTRRVVMSNAVHVYVSQAHKGELVMGAGIDAYNSYGQRGAFHVIERQMAAALELFPIFARAHVLRTWAGIVDVSPDASPIVGLTPVDGPATSTAAGAPAGSRPRRASAGCYAAHDRRTARRTRSTQPFSLDRFTTGALVDEHGAAAVAH